MHNAEALSRPNGFWKGTAQVLLHQSTFNTQSVNPADEAGPPAGQGWATAAQREAQSLLPGEDKGQANPSGLTHTFTLAEYKPADQVLATAPSGANESKVLIKRPLRPKVDVSEHLKLLLHSSSKPEPAQAAFIPCKQVAASSLLASACKGVTSHIVLKKRPQYTPTVGPAVATIADNAGQAVPQQAACGQQQHGSGTAALGVKRTATLAGVPLQPALLKRPKLATHSKQQASKAGTALPKAAASKANAAGKPAAARKAPAGPKASGKVPSVKAVAKPVSLQRNNPGAVPGPNPAVTAVTDVISAEGEAAASAVVPPNVSGKAALASLVASDSAAATTAVAVAAPAKAPRQRKKADDIDLAEVEKKIQDKFAVGKLADLSIPELKCFLKARKLPVGGKKSDLVARVEPLLAK